jgi:phosphoribosylformylglycinamidine (FGAM) synthase-like amidotransferase family enzyme
MRAAQLLVLLAVVESGGFAAADALRKGEARIAEIGRRLRAEGRL